MAIRLSEEQRKILKRKKAKYKKKQYYDIIPLLRKKADYNVSYSERSNGKTYQGKIVGIFEVCYRIDYYEFVENGKEISLGDRYSMAIFVRHKEDIDTAFCEGYFDDMNIKDITNGQFDCAVYVRGQGVYLGNVNPDTGKKEANEQYMLARFFGIDRAGEYKPRSSMYNNIRNIIFEEFVAPLGTHYLSDEPAKLMSLVSTIGRRSDVRIFLFGNPEQEYCPFFLAWDINPHKMKKGEIITKELEAGEDEFGDMTYRLLAVERGEVKSRANMLVGDYAKMGGSGELYQTYHFKLNEIDKMPDNFYKRKYYILFDIMGYMFTMSLMIRPGKEHSKFVYICPVTEGSKWARNAKRVVTDAPHIGKLQTSHLIPKTAYDKVIIDLIRDGKVFFPSDEIGTIWDSLMDSYGEKF